MTSITPGAPAGWSRIEAGYHTRRIGLHRVVEIVHLNHTPADKLHLERWVVRVVEHGKPTLSLNRLITPAEARRFANDWIEVQS